MSPDAAGTSDGGGRICDCVCLCTYAYRVMHNESCMFFCVYALLYVYACIQTHSCVMYIGVDRYTYFVLGSNISMIDA